MTSQGAPLSAVRRRVRALGARLPLGQSGAAGVAALTSVSLVAAMVLTAAPLPSAGVDLLQGGAWLVDRAAGTITHLNGFAGRPDARIAVGEPGGEIVVVQRPDGAYVLDPASGELTRVDGADLSAAVSRVVGEGGSALQVLTTGGTTWVLDRSAGLVQRVDPRTLEPVGAPVPLGAAAGEAVVDARGTLVVPLRDGSVAQVSPDGAVRRTAVAEPGSRLVVGLAGGTAVVYDPRSGLVRDLSDGTEVTVGAASRVAVGGSPDARTLVVVGDGRVSVVDLAAATVRLGPALPPGADITSVAVSGPTAYLLDLHGQRVETVDLGSGSRGRPVTTASGTADELVPVRGVGVVVNDTRGPDATVVRDDDSRTPVLKSDPERRLPGERPERRPDPTPEPDPASGAEQPEPEQPAGTPQAPRDGPPQAGAQPGATPAGGAPVPVPGGAVPGPAQGPAEQGARPPDAPIGVVASAGDGRVEVGWQHGGDGGSPLTGHVVLSGTTSVETDGAATSATFSAPNGRQVCVRVHAENALGRGASSAESCTTPSADAPGAPGSASAEAGDGTVRVRWTAAPAGRTPVVSYDVVLQPGGASQPVAATAALEATFTGLANGTAYSASVTARTATAAGPAARTEPVVPSGLPGAPDVTATGGERRITVTVGGGNPNGAAIADYRITVQGVAAREVPAGSHVFEGLAEGREYVVEAVARNANGTGAAATTRATTAAAPPPPPPPPPPPVQRQTLLACHSDNGVAPEPTPIDVFYAPDCAHPGWESRGRAFDIPTQAGDGRVALVRYSCGSTHWTKIGGAPTAACSTGRGWINDGVTGYVWNNPHDGAQRITSYRRGTYEQRLHRDDQGSPGAGFVAEFTFWA